MKSTNQDYASFKNDEKRLLAFKSRDRRIVILRMISALVILALAWLQH